MRSAVFISTLAAVMMAVTATPHPECDPCHEVSEADLDALNVAGKYLCCDLTCEYDPQPGCGIFGLPLVCKACYIGDETPAYDDPPIGSTPAPMAATTPMPVEVELGTPETEAPVESEVGVTPTEAPVEVGVSVTEPPVDTEVGVPETEGPVETEVGVPETESPVETEMPAMPAPTPSPVVPVMPTMSPDDGVTSTPVPAVPAATPSPSGYDCGPCEEAEMILSAVDLDALEVDGRMLVCDPDCLTESLDGCGAFGLGLVCRSVVAPTPAPIPALDGDAGTPSPSAAALSTPSPTSAASPSPEAVVAATPAPVPAVEVTPAPMDVVVVTPAPVDPTPAPVEEGMTTPAPVAATPSTPAPVSVASSSGLCTAEEEAACANLTPAQREALNIYDNGGKIIVCDPSCDDGVSDPIHCNYFGLGQRCRGCGFCSDCTPCP